MKIRPKTVEIDELERVYIASAMGQKDGPKDGWGDDVMATRETAEKFLEMAIQYALSNPHTVVKDMRRLKQEKKT